MELLAPAGNTDNFYTALESGADAVYIGAPGINARNLARDLSLKDIAVMIEYARKAGRKVYLAANSLILEKELSLLLSSLAVFNELKPDALIVQDLAVAEIALRHFPHLPVHASTLMGACNSTAVDLYSRMGCRRVVLARELTLKEIAELQRKSPIELEVFIHGAMCYSFSGLCLFSSYLGGKSGLRGRCVQPCRRGYSWGAGGRSEKGGGYLFSMNDLSGLSAVAELKKIGVASLKIEGRMRSANYVNKVVSAYRLLLDDDSEEALGSAQELIDEAMGRRTSAGYFFSPNPQDAVAPYHSGNMGLHLGFFAGVKTRAQRNIGKVRLKGSLSVGDRLRIHLEKSGERKAFTLKSLRHEGNEVTSAEAGASVQIELPFAPGEVPSGKIELYKVDGSDVAGDYGHETRCRKMDGAVQEHVRTAQRLAAGLETELLGPVDRIENEKELIPQQKRRARGEDMELWVRTDSVSLVFDSLPFKPDGYILHMEKRLLSQAGGLKKYFGKNVRNVIWAVPPVLFERDVPKVRKQIAILLRTGFKNFQLSHVSQLLLFGNERVNLYGDYTLNVANSAACVSLAENGFCATQVAIELDRESFEGVSLGYRAFLRHHPGVSKLRLGVTVYGAPPLFTSRFDASFFNYKKSFVSPKDESFFLRKEEGMVLAMPERPFSLLAYLPELREMGYDYAVIDLSRLKIGEKDKKELADRIQRRGRQKKLPTFNYLGSLL